MTTLQVQLPETTLTFLTEQAEANGLQSASEYLAALAVDAEANGDWIEKELAKGEASGPLRQMTRDDWDELKRRVWQRHEANTPK